MEVLGSNGGSLERPIAPKKNKNLSGSVASTKLGVEPRPFRFLSRVFDEVLLEGVEHLVDVDERSIERGVAVGQSDGENEELGRGEREKTGERMGESDHARSG